VEFKQSLQGHAPDRTRETTCAFANDLSGFRQFGIVAVGLRDDDISEGLAITDRLLAG